MSRRFDRARTAARVLAVAAALAPAAGATSSAAPAADAAGRSAPALAAAPAAASAPASPAAPAAAPAAPASDASTPPVPPYEFQPGVLCPLCRLTPEFPQGRSGLHWHDHWQTVGVREYVTVGALAAATLGLQFMTRPPARTRWNGPILLDDPLRDALRIGGAEGRREAETISDVLFVWEVLHPLVLDPLLVAWWRREAPFVAWQMLVIDAQAYGLTLLVNNLAKQAFGRARPWVRNGDCATDPDSSACGRGGRNLSFYSGHAAVTATGAGLLCAHHTQLNLYRNDYLDTGTCALAVLGTALTGAMRIASDNHWASDVFFGHLMGYASGYLMPTLLYYKDFRATPHDHRDGPQYATLPLVGDGVLGVTVLGLF